KKNISGDKIAWFHCSSLGEFEQGRPLMEGFRKQHPQYKILLTFFSPSGYEVRKNFDGADYIFYLPIDTPANANRFLDLIKPKIVFFIKYEFWFNYMKNLNKRGIPLFFIAVNFRKTQHFFKWYGSWFRKQLKNITHIFVQNEESLELLNKIGFKEATISGDTRFDRVFTITGCLKTFPLIQTFCNGSDIFIAGSSWPPDEDLIVALINSQTTKYKFIIAPHLVDKPHIASLVDKIKGHIVKYSNADEDNVKYAQVLILDSIGILSHVYQYGKIAYIGGGFSSSIHNILEAATFGMPVIFGPKYKKFIEAIELIKIGGAFSICNEKEFVDCISKLINNPDLLKKTGQIAQEYVKDNIGATEKILEHIKKIPAI
ncbi:MAG: 3-deoxy-D-manno-octulosonic acid transferase, partial [Bacteroidetes bacterium]|nr:3-deoxy-D-manno-octulosonic acid transferase [Bacteroidota bacterium]